jgi:hypothetical protein
LKEKIMRKLKAAITLLSLSTGSVALAQSRNTFMPIAPSTDWNQNSNWSFNTVPSLSDDVLIPEGETCIVSGSTDALAKSLEVQTGALLEIQDGLTLQIRPPANHTYADLQLDGTILFTDATETGVLRLEMSGILTHVFEILGEGQLIGDPAEIQTSTGTGGSR